VDSAAGRESRDAPEVDKVYMLAGGDGNTSCETAYEQKIKLGDGMSLELDHGGGIR
jgi:hypothetical protein